MTQVVPVQVRPSVPFESAKTRESFEFAGFFIVYTNPWTDRSFWYGAVKLDHAPNISTLPVLGISKANMILC